MSRHILNPGFFTTSNAEIERLCKYIGDDQTVANYFGIERERVEAVRATLPKQKPAWLRAADIDTPATNGGVNSHMVAADEAERGSRKLNASIQAMFRRWEKKHGFQHGAAERLLLAGYVPERQAA